MVAGKIGGEIAALDGGLRTATWIAIESTTVFAIARTNLLELMTKRPEFAHHMVEVLCQRVRTTSQQVEDAAFLAVPERLARQILSMVSASEQSLPCRIQISQRELAAFLNASRQVVNGYLQEWQRLGFIKVGRGYVEVQNTVGMLEHAAQS
jgi:CRP/FNR family cyclic AMP-dependent transcriptional regulator